MFFAFVETSSRIILSKLFIMSDEFEKFVKICFKFNCDSAKTILADLYLNSLDAGILALFVCAAHPGFNRLMPAPEISKVLYMY